MHISRFSCTHVPRTPTELFPPVTIHVRYHHCRSTGSGRLPLDFPSHCQLSVPCLGLSEALGRWSPEAQGCGCEGPASSLPGNDSGLACIGRCLGEVGAVLCQGRLTGSVASTRPRRTSPPVCGDVGIWLWSCQPGAPGSSAHSHSPDPRQPRHRPVMQNRRTDQPLGLLPSPTACRVEGPRLRKKTKMSPVSLPCLPLGLHPRWPSP